MTTLIYAEYPNLFEIGTKINNYALDQKGMYVVLEKSIFYPQGGGQPADQGQIISENNTYKVFDVRKIDDEVRHYVVHEGKDIDVGESVVVIVDKNRRILNSKYHTAGHLIASVAERLCPELTAIKGHQFPGEAYVEFKGKISDTDGLLKDVILNTQNIIASNAVVKTEDIAPADIAKISKNLPYSIPTDKPLRVCCIEGFAPVPCGGTHVSFLQEINALEIRKCKSKKGKTKIHYEVL